MSPLCSACVVFAPPPCQERPFALCPGAAVFPSRTAAPTSTPLRCSAVLSALRVWVTHLCRCVLFTACRCVVRPVHPSSSSSSSFWAPSFGVAVCSHISICVAPPRPRFAVLLPPSGRPCRCRLVFLAWCLLVAVVDGIIVAGDVGVISLLHGHHHHLSSKANSTQNLALTTLF